MARAAPVGVRWAKRRPKSVREAQPLTWRLPDTPLAMLEPLLGGREPSTTKGTVKTDVWGWDR